MIKFNDFLLESALDFLRQPYNTLQEVLVARDALHDCGGKTYLGIWIDNTINFIKNDILKEYHGIENLTRLAHALDNPAAGDSLENIGFILNSIPTINICEYQFLFKNIKEICDNIIAYLHPNPNKSEIVFETIKRSINECLLEETIKEHCD